MFECYGSSIELQVRFFSAEVLSVKVKKYDTSDRLEEESTEIELSKERLVSE